MAVVGEEVVKPSIGNLFFVIQSKSNTINNLPPFYYPIKYND